MVGGLGGERNRLHPNFLNQNSFDAVCATCHCFVILYFAKPAPPETASLFVPPACAHMKLHLVVALVSLADLVSTALHELEPSDDLQATITSAAAGDRIELDAGRYTSSASDNAFTLDKSLTIVAKEGRKAILDGQNARRVLNLGSSGSPTNYVFEGLVLTNGLADEFGGALKISLPPDESGSITIDDCEVSSSSASQGEGGGLWFSVAVGRYEDLKLERACLCHARTTRRC